MLLVGANVAAEAQAASSAQGSGKPASTQAAPAQPQSPALTSAQRAKRTKVYVQGDSLTVGSATDIRRLLKGRVKQVSVDARIGRHTTTGLSRTRASQSAKRARVWVMALGTNDAPSHRTVKKQMSQSLKMAGKQRQVIWVTLERPGNYERVNRMMRTFGARHPRLHIVDWAKETRKNRSILAGDRVHATHTGYRIRASMISRKAQELAGTL